MIDRKTLRKATEISEQMLTTPTIFEAGELGQFVVNELAEALILRHKGDAHACLVEAVMIGALALAIDQDKLAILETGSDN